MTEIADHKIEVPQAAEAYPRGRADRLADWLDGVTTRDGLAAVRAVLGTR